MRTCLTRLTPCSSMLFTCLHLPNVLLYFFFIVGGVCRRCCLFFRRRDKLEGWLAGRRRGSCKLKSRKKVEKSEGSGNYER